MDVRSRTACKTLEEIRHQLALKISNEASADLRVDSERGTTTEVDGGDGESLIHGHQEVSRTQDPSLIAQCAIKGFTQRYTYIFNRMVLVHIEITVALEAQIEGTVPREKLQHVVKETNAGRNLVLSSTFDGELDCNPGFGRIALKSRSANW